MGFWEPLFFWIFAAGAVASSAAVILFRNPLYSALALIVDFFFFAGLYGLLSAHFIAVTQILVYAGAIMVLFLFIIMLLNLKDDELGEFEFRIHHVLSGAAIVGLFFIIASSLLPLVDQDAVAAGRAQAIDAHLKQAELYAAEVTKAEALEGPQGQAQLRALRAREPELVVATPTKLAVAGQSGPLWADLNEPGLEAAWSARVDGYKQGRSMALGKYPRFSPQVPEVVPPGLTGDGLTTDRGTIRSGPGASFGTIEPLSLLIVNRFVVPFELTALLLLAAIVGAVIIAKRRL